MQTIINNTTDHINRLNIEFTKKSATEFLLDYKIFISEFRSCSAV